MTDNKFTWVPFFKEVHEKIHNNYNAEQLANIANEIFGHIKDIDDQGNEVSIQEMTPINFIGYFNRRLTLNNRVLYCKKLREIMNLNSDIPTDFDGIPEFNNQNCLCMPFKKDRANYIIQEQWEISKQILENNIKTELFDKILSNAHPWIGLSYLSRFCFIVKPEKYYPYDKQMAINLNAKMPETFKGYEDYCKLLKYTYPEKTSYELSYEAFMENNNKQNKKQLTSQKKYWIYQPGEQGRLWNEVYANNIIAIGWEELGDLKQYNSEGDLSEKITEIYSKKSNPDKLANWEFANVMNIGDIVYVKKGSKDLIGRGIVQSDYYFDDTRSEYKSVRKIQWTHNGNYNVDFNELGIKQWVQKTLTNISENKYKDFCLKIEDIFMNSDQIKTNDTISLNQILYGPPGTGKTYKANQMINVFNKYNEGIFKKNKKILKDLSDLTWSEAIALGMSTDNQGHTPNEIYELKYTKEYLDNKKQSGRKTPECSLRSDLMRNTVKNEQLAESGKTGNDYFVYENGKYKLSDNGKLLAQELLKAENEKFNVSDFCKFVTFHQSYSYEDFVIGIKPKEEEDNLLFKKQRGIFKKLCDEALNNPDYKYLLIIDEINRGNISKIFGELITLIEDKKRWGNEEQMSTILPTGDVIKVPSNLYILGTMNTADKSLALLDAALRRRFEFIPMYPKYIIEDENGNNLVRYSNFLKSLNEEILKKKQSADYMIGHSYFMNDKSLEEILNVSVIPLLMEYFNNKVTEVKILLDKIADIKYNSEYLYDNDKYFYLKVETATERIKEENQKI